MLILTYSVNIHLKEKYTETRNINFVRFMNKKKNLKSFTNNVQYIFPNNSVHYFFYELRCPLQIILIVRNYEKVSQLRTGLYNMVNR